MKELFQAIITQAIDDLYETGREREEAWRWFKFKEMPYELNSVTFMDACDLADAPYFLWKEVARRAYTGEMSYEQYIEYKSVTNKLEKAPKHSPVIVTEELPRTSYLYTNQEAQDEAGHYLATL